MKYLTGTDRDYLLYLAKAPTKQLAIESVAEHLGKLSRKHNTSYLKMGITKGVENIFKKAKEHLPKGLRFEYEM